MTSKQKYMNDMNALADAINLRAGQTGKKTIVELKNIVNGIVIPTGNKNITTTAQVDVAAFATAQVVDSDLVPENIRKDVNILGVTGTFGDGVTYTQTGNVVTIN